MRACLLALVALAGCSSAQLPGLDDGLAAPRVDALHPALVLPSSELDLVGAGFADPARAATLLVLDGTFTPAGGAAQPVLLTLAATQSDDGHASAVAAGAAWTLAGSGHFDGTVVAQSVDALDGSVRSSDPVAVAFDVADRTTPTLTSLTPASGTLHVNDLVTLTGDGFLLGTGEGETRVVVAGVEVVAHPLPDAPWDRTRVAFPFVPAIAGIAPAEFAGSVAVRNVLPGGPDAAAGTLPLAVTIVAPEITGVSTTVASLGQYVDIDGAGFIGAAADEVTLLHLVGSFRAGGANTAAPIAVDVTLVPHFSDGTHLRYVLDEADALGRLIDLRQLSGTFTGNATPMVEKGNVQVTGAPHAAVLAVAPVKQVVYIRFLPSYVDSLRLFGLANADALVRARIFAVAARDYAGVNVEFRATPPDDFALYSIVDVEGPDPNDEGLLGYDNTPGKDVGNERLFDHLGGVNATTQSDGFPGYGGIFAENFMGFSSHPSSGVARLDVDPSHFDAVFDPVRPDTGRPVSVAEAKTLVVPDDTSACLTRKDRASRIGCAVLVLGNLIGTTLTHETGHSLGLADPTGADFHDPGDGPNRLMDAGGARPFEERAELLGQGPGVFCDDEYIYLRGILPGSDAAGGDSIARPDCN